MLCDVTSYILVSHLSMLRLYFMRVLEMLMPQLRVLFSSATSFPLDLLMLHLLISLESLLVSVKSFCRIDLLVYFRIFSSGSDQNPLKSKLISLFEHSSKDSFPLHKNQQMVYNICGLKTQLI